MSFKSSKLETSPTLPWITLGQPQGSVWSRGDLISSICMLIRQNKCDEFDQSIFRKTTAHLNAADFALLRFQTNGGRKHKAAKHAIGWEEDSKCTPDLAWSLNYCNYKCPEKCFHVINPLDISLRFECGMWWIMISLLASLWLHFFICDGMCWCF